MIERDAIELCEDCTIIAVHGYSDTASDEQTSASLAGIDRLQRDGGHLVPSYDGETGRGIEEFTWRPCACCCSKLGGSRHEFATIA